jgi:hypothetical protein
MKRLIINAPLSFRFGKTGNFSVSWHFEAHARFEISNPNI